LNTDPAKGVAFADSMVAALGDRAKAWRGLRDHAAALVEARRLIDAGHGDQALGLLSKQSPSDYPDTRQVHRLLVADALLTANPRAAYDTALALLAKSPSDRLKHALPKYANAAGKSAQAIERDLATRRAQNAKTATPFTLARYTPPDSASLS